MTVERSLHQRNIPPTGRRRTPWTKHYKRASSLITADLDTALKELEFKLVPEPLKLVTNHIPVTDDENCFSPREQHQKTSLLLPLMSEEETTDNPAFSLRPILKHSSEGVRIQLSPSRTEHIDQSPVLLTPKLTREFPAMPPTPRKCRKRNSIIELDTANAPAGIFLPLDL